MEGTASNARQGGGMTLVIHGKPAPQPRVRAYRR